jgi:N-acetylated-alpha-linked acidic dipeptidase
VFPVAPLGALEKRIREFQMAGQDLNRNIMQTIAGGQADRATVAQVNEVLMHVERNWSIPQGIPGRPWFKHSLYGTRYTYAHLELPGLTEAAEAGQWKRASEQAKIIEDELVKNTDLLRHVQQELDSISGAAKP